MLPSGYRFQDNTLQKRDPFRGIEAENAAENGNFEIAARKLFLGIPSVWKRNLLLCGACLAGIGAVALSLLRVSPIQDPPDFDPNRYRSSEYRQILEGVDREFAAVWEAKGVSPAPPAEELAVIRRLSLSLAGTIPSLEEIRALEKVPQGERIEWWISRLLADRRTADYLAERLARAYVGTEDGPFLLFRRRRFVIWLSDRIADRNRPLRYDDLVRDLLTSEGLWTDTPAVNFVTSTLDNARDNQPDPIRLAGRTSRAFLGMRIDCLQCHDDKLGNIALGTENSPREGTQQDFHRLAAFFAGTQTTLRGLHDRSQKKYRYQYLNAKEEEEVPPAAPFFAELLSEEGSHRQRLADWVTHRQNRPFARATVNRFWAILFGKPLASPVDDIPLHGNFPPGLELLADDLIEHDFDLRRLIRILAGLRVFQLDSRAEHAITPLHEKHWGAFPLTRLRPEQVAGSVIQASTLKTIDANAHVIAQLQRYNEQKEFIERYGDPGQDEFQDRGGTIPQRLLMMNGKLVKERTEPKGLFNAATQIASLTGNDRTAIEAAYLATLQRQPSSAEADHFADRLKNLRGPARHQALEDLYWVLLNSTEFCWNH